MDSHAIERRTVDTDLSAEPEIGRWLWALQETHERTLRALEGLDPALVEWNPPGSESSIGTVLYHMADIEADWLYVEVLEQDIPPEVAALFPFPTRDEHGRLTQIYGFTLEQHLSRLAAVRDLLVKAFQRMDLLDFRRLRTLEHYAVTPEWVLHHMIQHEAELRGQIGAMRARAENQ